MTDSPASPSRRSSSGASYDVVVVGLGLIGSAALRHLSATGRRVVGIGPGEPPDRASWTGPFASHHDSGRVTRRLDAVLEWAVLASRAIEQYPIIAERSGIEFHTPAGLVFVRDDVDGVARQRAVADALKIPIEVSTTDGGLVASCLAFPPGLTSLAEPAPAGHIDPRKLRSAQLRCAELDGAEVRAEPATVVTRSDRGWIVDHPSGSVEADRLLLATGPYPNDLLDVEFAVSVRPEAIVMAEVGTAARKALIDMPSVIHLRNDHDFDDVYFVPPAQYPDGKWYVKMGGSRAGVRAFATADEKHAWMAGDDADEQLSAMQRIFRETLPGTEFDSWTAKPCLISDTASGLPFVDQLGSGAVVAIGGNGHAAKSSDAIGALAAGLVINDGEWTDPELDADRFHARFGHFEPPLRSRHAT